MITLVYVTIAIAFLILILGLLARTRSEEINEDTTDKGYVPHRVNALWLSLSECIFNPSDARWLRDELSFPELAQSLTHARKQMAIQWLKALQVSFNTLVRTTAPSPLQNPGANSMEGWRLLWLTVRFQILLSYALMVVNLFGPYHRLIPSFTWVPFLKEGKSPLHRSVLAGSGDLN